MADQQHPDRIARMFEGKSVFITGGTGFLGKLLVEKLLRCCPGVKAIYLLIRNKKGKAPQDRINDIFLNVVFDVLKKENPKAFDKCKPIPGDVTEVNLGLSPEDRKLITEECQFIYHSAASTRFDDTVKVAAKMNTRGTKYVLDLANECKNLKAFVHISTAYAYPDEKVLYERAYKPPADPHYILKNIDFDKTGDEDEATHLQLLGSCPNTYTFTKALAEGLVIEQMNKLPSIIVRPSVVCPTWLEPFPGWCNNLQGPMGLFVGAGKGIIRTMYLKGEYFADFIPADLTVNATLLGTWALVEQKSEQRIYNVTSSGDHNINWEQLIETGKDIIYNELPFNGAVWYPGGSPKRSKTLHTICFYLLQLIPAIFIDALLLILGYKPILFQIQRRIQKSSEMFEYYTTKTWDFRNEKLRQLIHSLNPREYKTYKIDSEGFVLRDYLIKCLYSVRRYNLKETDETIPSAKRHLFIMKIVHIITQVLFWFGVLYYSYRWIIEPIYFGKSNQY